MHLSPRLASFISGSILILACSCSPLNNVRVDERYGKRIAYVLEGQGMPTVIFEAGFDAGMETWIGVLDSVAQHSRVYAYDRPGYGKSNKRSAPHSVREVAEQLHANLIARNIDPPYLLVGHSEGALMINMFARLYPIETSGVLMIDPTHPELYDYLKENEELIYNVLIDFAGRGQRFYEFDIIKNCSEEFEKAPPFPEDVPLTVLMAGRHTILESEALKAKTMEYHEDLKRMSKTGKRYLIEDSNRLIHKQDPNRVISEILNLMYRPD